MRERETEADADGITGTRCDHGDGRGRGLPPDLIGEGETGTPLAGTMANHITATTVGDMEGERSERR